jgi:hypothetical protein
MLRVSADWFSPRMFRSFSDASTLSHMVSGPVAIVSSDVSGTKNGSSDEARYCHGRGFTPVDGKTSLRIDLERRAG